ncbi:MAG: flagellar biosynthesis protein FlhB [Candidatus Eremiobacteraeota bacterium]|nr:flagellar biosynthesis protein FlhB [Candidatus Eremiobacteraeota bacterium]
MSEEKTEQPTGHKLSEARKKGQVVKSKDAATGIFMLIMFFGFASMGKNIISTLMMETKKRAVLYSKVNLNQETILNIYNHSLVGFFKALGPILFLAVVASVAGHLIQRGWAPSLQSIMPKLDKINPIEGLKRIFSQKGFIEFLKILIRTLGIVLIFRAYLLEKLPLIMRSSAMYTNDAISFYGSIAMGFAGRITLWMVVIGGFDYFLQRYLFMKQMQMTKKELKDELKSTDGDPHLKQRLRERQRAFIQQRMLEGVKTARVVITNPTHFAVALKYDEETNLAPVVVAKGKDHLAESIKALARQNSVHLYENKSLAQLLYKNTDIGETIPPELYKSVAEVIAFIERLGPGMERRKNPGK